MSPLDRIAQLNARLRELETANALLRSQLADGQEQAKRDSATIARLSAHEEELAGELFRVLPFVEDLEENPCYKKGYVSGTIKRIRAVLQRYSVREHPQF